MLAKKLTFDPTLWTTISRAKTATRFLATTRGGWWMPFTDHQRFNNSPKVLESADGMYYTTVDGKKILDGMSGLWAVNAGHNQPKITEAIQKQAGKLDFCPTFNMAHNGPSIFASKILELLNPKRNFRDVFFTICGSTAVDSALKMALTYHRAKGEGQKTRFIGRDRSYHGVGFGGIAVGGMVGNRKPFAGNQLPNVSHIAHTHSLPDMAFSKGLPTWGTHLAEDLERVIALNDPSTIAAVIIEPVAGSTGVLPPPVGYLKRIRDICTKHGILLIFDEVITGFGRLGASFAVEKFDITPDIITCAKGLTNAAVPCGAVITQAHVFDTIHDAAHRGPDMQVEFFHGYTYSGHPLSMAAGIAAMDVFKEQKLFERANELAPYWEELLHSLKGLPNVVDIRNYGLMGAVEIQPIPGLPSKRAQDVFDRIFHHGVLLRCNGTSIACSPPLISEKKDLERIVDTLGKAIKESAAVM